MSDLRFGFGGISCQRYPGSPRSDLQLYADAVRVVEEAERAGFDSAWVSEHHFSDDAFMPSGLLFCAAAAMRTRRITVGTAVLLAPLCHRLRLAEEAATVDLLSAGRFVLGLGLGYMPREYEAFGVDMAERARLLEELVPVLRRAWSGDLVGIGAPVTAGSSAPGVVVTPQPSAPGRPPIWLGGEVESSIRRAGRLGDGFVATYVADPSELSRQLEWARVGAESAGKNPSELEMAVNVPVFAWDEGDAWKLVREHYHYLTWKYDDLRVVRDRRGLPKPAPALDAGRERQIRRNIIVGSSAEVAEGVQSLVDAAGGRLHFIARLYFPGLDPAVQEQALWIFAERVAGALR